LAQFPEMPAVVISWRLDHKCAVDLTRDCHLNNGAVFRDSDVQRMFRAAASDFRKSMKDVAGDGLSAQTKPQLHARCCLSHSRRSSAHRLCYFRGVLPEGFPCRCQKHLFTGPHEQRSLKIGLKVADLMRNCGWQACQKFGSTANAVPSGDGQECFERRHVHSISPPRILSVDAGRWPCFGIHAIPLAIGKPLDSVDLGSRLIALIGPHSSLLAERMIDGIQQRASSICQHVTDSARWNFFRRPRLANLIVPSVCDPKAVAGMDLGATSTEAVRSLRMLPQSQSVCCGCRWRLSPRSGEQSRVFS